MPKIILQNVHKQFDNGPIALQNINLEIGDGEFFVVVGSTSSGKSTLLRLIAGLDVPTSGKIFIDGKQVHAGFARDYFNMAMVFQHRTLDPDKTVFNNMAVGLNLRKYPRREILNRVNDASKFLAISYLLSRKMYGLSSGEQQKIVLGRALARKPKLFLLDEPLSNIDATMRGKIVLEIKKIRMQLGKSTFIYVTHDPLEAVMLGDRVAVMEAGRIVQVATPQDLYSHPNNLCAAQFVGLNNMNIVEGILKRQNEKLFFSTELFKISKESGTRVQ